MDTTDFRGWYSSKIQMADEIVRLYGTKGEPDAEILLCCATSGLAALMWSGKGLDQRRFIEFLVRFALPDTHVKRISIPLLAEKMEEKKDDSSAQLRRNKFLPQNPALGVDGDQIDQCESIIFTLLPHLARKEVRESSYAGSIYLDLRCGLIHEYQLSPHLESWGVVERTDIPGYVNLRIPPDPAEVKRLAQLYRLSEVEVAFALAKPTRLLHFPYNYVRRVLASSADSAFNYWDSATSWEQPKPQNWWVEG